MIAKECEVTNLTMDESNHTDYDRRSIYVTVYNKSMDNDLCDGFGHGTQELFADLRVV